MGGRSAPRRYAGLFEERAVGKAAKRGGSAPKLLSRRDPGAFCRKHPFKPFFASLGVQGKPIVRRKKKTTKQTEMIAGRGGSLSPFPRCLWHFGQAPLENGFDSFTS